jgi:acetylornithine/N-succinyldiaminopimelate aminotransferase
MVPPGFLALCRKLASERGALLLFDEVQTGMGRTGTMFAYQHEGVVPDVLSVAKGIGGGLPLGAILATEEVGTHLAYGTHATTFGGNPVACAAGLVVMDELASPGFLPRVAELGHAMMKGLTEINERFKVFKEVRGRGLLIGAELAPGLGFEAKHIVDVCRENGVLTHIAGPNVLRLAPPLILSEREAAEGLAAIDRAIAKLARA